ncbi:sulfatase [Candidatus Latescibacterota bacterium]
MTPFERSRRDFMKTAGAGIGSLALSPAVLSAQNTKAKKPNVLFIAVDDLRPELSCYGETQIISPNIDRLASGGTLFTRSHCNVPVCGASRASLLTGVRPLWDRFVNYQTRADEDLPGHLSLPRFLKNNSYHTISNGKIYHHKDDDPGGWSEPAWGPSGDWAGWQAYIADESNRIIEENRKQAGNNAVKGPAWEAPDCADNDYPDGKTADKTIEDLRRLAQKDQPFFLAAGFLKPHLPFNAPKKYWDLYDHDSIELTDNPYRPQNVPDQAIHNSGELRGGYSNVPESTPLPEDYARWLVHGYYACVSYTDAQIGKLLNELDRLGLRDNTVVILWGDHGWNLGEHTMWCKHCNFETSLRAPVIISAPGYDGSQKSDALVEYVDIYPTIAELCGFDIPGHCEGISFVPLMSDPGRKWKDAVFSRWIKGDTVTTKRYQYTQWRNEDGGPVTARMLYDHDTDPDENVNVAENPKYARAAAEMSKMLADGWKSVKMK